MTVYKLWMAMACGAALARMHAALAAEGLTPEIRTLLSQAQGALTAAQISLVPVLLWQFQSCTRFVQVNELMGDETR